jgi:hypothetical protein
MTCAAPKVWPVGRRPTICGRRVRAVPRGRRADAVVAVAATVATFLAEVREQRPTPAVGDLAPPEQRVELVPLAPFVLLVGLRRIDELA